MAKADDVGTVQLVLNDGSSAASFFGLNSVTLPITSFVSTLSDGSYFFQWSNGIATDDTGVFSVGMWVAPQGTGESIRIACLGVLAEPRDPDPGSGEAACQSVGGTLSVDVYTDVFSKPFFTVTDTLLGGGLVTFLPGTYEDFQPFNGDGTDATLIITPAPEPGSLGLLLAGLAPMFFVLFLRSVAPDSNVSRCVRSAGP